MLSGWGLTVFLLLATTSALSSGQPCSCSALRPSGLRVNCSFLDLIELQHLPADTAELLMHGNRLTSVRPGLFDSLERLRRVSLSGNPFHCDCRIQYLRSWLRRNRKLVSKEPTCSSPSSAAGKAIADLPDDLFASCATKSCTSDALNAVLGAMLCGLIALLLWSLRLARNSTFILCIDERQPGFEGDQWRWLRLKQRRRRHTTSSEGGGDSDLPWIEDMQRPLVNVELLPQVLDVLHRKHNIKIKAT